MRKACHQTRDWQERFPREDGDLPLSVSVNLSVKQFLQADLAERVKRILDESRLDARSLIWKLPKA